jgi:gliding motility-associated-like protein
MTFFIPTRVVLFFLLVLAGLGWSARSYGQGAQVDSITYSSTCVGSTIEFGSSVFNRLPFPQSVSWNFGDPSSGIYDSSNAQNPLHAFASTGAYPLELTVINAPGDTVKVFDTISVVTPLNYNFGPDIYLCQGHDTLLTGPSVPGAVYAWNDPDTTHTDTLRITKSGVYTIAVNGCGVSDSIGVYISAKPAINLGANHVMCDSANLLLNATTQNGHYTWLLNGSPLSFTGGQLLTQYPGGTYEAIDSVPGCGVDSATVSITYSSPLSPGLSLGPDTLLCPKQVFYLNASIPSATAYSWSTGSTDSLIQVTQAGAYWVFVTYDGQCQLTDTVNVTYIGNVQLDFHDTSICQGSSLELNANFGQGTYSWTAIPPQRDDQNQTGQSVYYVYTSGTYAVLATVGQCIYTDTVKVSMDDSLKVSMVKDTTLCNGEEFFLKVQGNADSLLWANGQTGTSFQVNQSGTYQVFAKNGCGMDTLEAVVNFKACTCDLLLPNAFTPNGDGNNDYFRPLHPCDMSDFHMVIFNRYGQKVFESSDPTQPWDGTFKGAKVPSDNFVWEASYTNTTTSHRVQRKGFVIVIR